MSFQEASLTSWVPGTKDSTLGVWLLGCELVKGESRDEVLVFLLFDLSFFGKGFREGGESS